MIPSYYIMSNFLYLIKCNEFFKIGVAGNVESRLAALQTGNPYQLSLESCYEFDNASIVEQCLHQKFSTKNESGEWFSLDKADLQQFEQICNLLNGKKSTETVAISKEDTEEADLIGEIISKETQTPDKFDFEKMMRDGWRIERNHKYWLWRRGSGNNRESMYGGRVDDLPEQFSK